VEQLAYTLREIADQTGLSPLKHIARQPGLKAAYRVTVRYPDRRAHNSVATLRYSSVESIGLEVVYQQLFRHKPLAYEVSPIRYQAFVAAFQKAGFDHLPDQPKVPFYGVDLWLVERAAGTFIKSVILAPQKADEPHLAIVNAVRDYLPEAVREI
jgi:hypothetical protein